MKKRPLLTAVIISVVMAAGFAAVMLAVGGKGQMSLPGLGDKVGVVEVNGTIISSAPAIFALKSFRQNRAIKAIILRVDSPGGGVAASQEIFREVRRTAKVKPVVCSMGSVAASGGYYIAAPCNRILASRGTLTGSIGVIASIPDLTGLFGKIGLHMQYVQAGKLKGAGAPGRPLSQAERQMLKTYIDQAHEQFIGDVLASRKIDPARLRAMADGRVISGQAAKELGLIDGFGNFNDAAALAARLGGISGEPELVRYEPEDDNWILRLLKNQARTMLREALDQAGAPAMQYIFNPAATD